MELYDKFVDIFQDLSKVRNLAVSKLICTVSTLTLAPRQTFPQGKLLPPPGKTTSKTPHSFSMNPWDINWRHIEVYSGIIEAYWSKFRYIQNSA